MQNEEIEKEIIQSGKGGYELIGILGYVFTEKTPGTRPLKQFWSTNRKDYHLTALELGQGYALGSNYELVRIEGYIPEKPGVENAEITNVEIVAPWCTARNQNYSISTPGYRRAFRDNG